MCLVVERSELRHLFKLNNISNDKTQYLRLYLILPLHTDSEIALCKAQIYQDCNLNCCYFASAGLKGSICWRTNGQRLLIAQTRRVKTRYASLVLQRWPARFKRRCITDRWADSMAPEPINNPRSRYVLQATRSRLDWRYAHTESRQAGAIGSRFRFINKTDDAMCPLLHDAGLQGRGRKNATRFRFIVALIGQQHRAVFLRVDDSHGGGPGHRGLAVWFTSSVMAPP